MPKSALRTFLGRQRRALRKRFSPENRRHFFISMSAMRPNRRVFDCVMLYEEVELLLLRFMEYYDYVDHFVVVESRTTFTGNRRDPIFEANRDLFEPYLDKVVYVLLDDLPANTSDKIWIAENFQRNAIERGLRGLARRGDLIFVSDVDELWPVDQLSRIRRMTTPAVFEHRLYYYFLDYLSPAPILGCVAYPYPWETPQQARDAGRRRKFPIVAGGWHYSYLGGFERIKHKLGNLSDAHTVADRIGDDGEIRDKIARGVALWDESIQYTPGSLDWDNAPAALPRLVERFPDLVSSAQQRRAPR